MKETCGKMCVSGRNRRYLVGLLIVLLLFLMPTAVFAEEAGVSGDGAVVEEGETVQEATPAEEFTYSVLNGTYCSITGYTGTRAEITIPGEIDGYIVQSISNSAFAGNTTLTKVTLADSIESMGSYVFKNCTSLTTFISGSSLGNIGSEAFRGCTALTSVTFATGLVRIDGYAFSGCSALTEVNLPETLTTIYAYAFEGCTSLEGIVLPDSITALGGRAFYNCTKLSSVNYPASWSGTDNFEVSPFIGCSSLKSIVVPEGVTAIPNYAFSGMTSLTDIRLPESLTSIGAYAFYHAEGLTSLELPAGLQSMGRFAFAGIAGLERVDLSESTGLTAISRGAFSRCRGLKEVKLPDTLTTIYEYAFQECSGLEEIILPDSITVLSGYAFYNCTKLSSVNYPANWSTTWSYGISPFAGCSSLRRIVVPEGVTAIPSCAFYGMTSLTSISLPESLTSIGANAFYDADRLKSVELPAGLQSIGSYAFESSGLERIDLSKNTELTLISSNTFSKCIGLKEVKLPQTLTKIYSYAFQYCTSLEEIVLPDSITTLGSHAFYNCTKLSKINYPASWSATSANASPFTVCSSLKSIVVPEGVTAIPTYAFQGMTSLTEIRLPESLTSIGAYAFYGTSSLETIEFPDSLTTLGDYAFTGSGLSVLNLPENLTGMGTYAFQNCISLRNIYLNGLQTVPDNAFSGCTGLVSVVLNDDLKGINSQAFANCTNLTAIYIPKGIEFMASDAFSGCEKLTIYCYSGTVAHTTAESNGIPFQLLDEHEHEYGTAVETEATCTRSGSQAMICSICGYTYIELTDPLGHDEPEKFTVDVEMTCTQDGHQVKACLRCGEILAEEVIPSAGHQCDEWTIEKEATLYYPGSRWCVCSVCQERLEEEIPQLELTDDIRDQYGVAHFHVVDATTKEPISGAQLHVKLSEEETLTILTDSQGEVSQLLPVGSVRISVYADGKMSRSITVTVTSGECTIPEIGLSDTELVSAQLTVTEMSYQEIVDAGIDVEDPSNQQVYKHAVKLEFSASIDVLNMFYYVNIDGIAVGGDYSSHDWQFTGTSSSGLPIMRYKDPKGETTITVYPVSEEFYLIIYGDVRWLKEMFDIEMLVINNSLTDTLEDCTATLSLPEGLSLAAMTGDQQTMSIAMGDIAAGAQKSAHWYVRGDEHGDYSITARLTGTLQPFGEVIDRVYQAEDSIHVYAGSAMQLTYYVPDAAYYGKDYVVRAELENVSDKALYNVSNLITGIKEGKITHYSDGSVKEEVYLEENGVIASTFAQTFLPGDKLVIELSIPILFESGIIQGQLDAVSACLTMTEKMSNAIHMFDVASDAIEGYGSFFDSLWDMTDAGKISNIGPKLNAVNDGLGLAETLLDHPDETNEVYNIWDGLRNVIQTIPVRFDLIRSSVEVLDGSTTEIPTSIVTIHESGEPWAINIGQYLMKFIIAAFGENAEVPDTGIWPIDFALENLLDVQEAMGYDDAIEYLKAVDGQVQTMVAYAPGEDAKVRVWSENGSLSVTSVGPGGQVSDGVMTINGSSYINVTPNGQDDTLYIEVNGKLKTFVFDVVPAHTCSGEWKVLYYATEQTEGAEVLVCSTCGMVLDTRKTSSCGSHSFCEYETDVEPTEDTLGIQTRVCENCHVIEYRFIDAGGVLQSLISFDANGGEGELPAAVVQQDESYALPECTFTHETLKFVCWNTQADGSGENYAPGTQLQFADDAVFYAIWSETGLLEYDLSNVKLDNTLLPYQGQEQTVSITGLPEDVVIVSVTGTTATEIGEYVVTAELAAGDAFHAVPVLPELKWSIQPAILYDGATTKAYDGTGSLNGRFVLLVDETVVTSYASVTTDDNGTEVVTELADAPTAVGTYRLTAEVTFGQTPYTETLTVDYEITPRAVTVAPVKMVHEYDGETVVNQNYTADNLVSGHSIAHAVIEGSETLPGLYEDAFTISEIVIVDASGKDVTENYQVTCEAADLEIVKRTVRVTVNDVSVVYDGTSHGGESYQAENLLEGHNAVGFSMTGAGTDAGYYRNWLTLEGGQVVDAEGNDLMDLYQFQYVPGSMQIALRPVWIAAKEVVHEYDATLVENPGYEVRNLAENQQIQSLVISGGETLPGSYPAEFIPGSAVIVDAEGSNVTTNYQITYEASDLVIEKRRVTVTALDETVVYDAQLHQGASATADRLLEGHALGSMVFEDASICDAGTWTDAIVITSATVVDAENTDLMHLYELRYAPGTLVIEQRPVTVTALDKVWEYDGTVVTNDRYTIDNLVDGHEVESIVITGEATLPGSYEALFQPRDAVIAQDDTDVTGNYAITYVNGDLTIEKRKVTLTADDVTLVYDGMAHAGDTHTADRLLDGHTSSVLSWTSEATDAGTYVALLLPEEGVVLDAEGNDLMHLYELSYLPGTLTIEKRPATITALDAEYEYDDQPKNGVAFTADNLARNQTVAELAIAGSAVLPGDYPDLFVPDAAVIRNADCEDVTKNYEVTYVSGKLMITPRKLTVSAYDAAAEYDDQNHGGNGVMADRLVSDHRIAGCTVAGEAVDAGTYADLLMPTSVQLVDGNGEPVNDRYEITFLPGNLTITRRSLTVTANTVEQEYDGTAVGCDEFTHVGEVEGHCVTADLLGEEVLPGIYENKWLPENVRITDADHVDETDNYEITCIAGNLTIRKRRLTVTANDVTLEYDDQAHGGSDVTADRLLENHLISGSTVAGDAVDAGAYPDILVPANVQLTDDAGLDVTDRYEISYLPGTLTITPKALTVTANSAEHEYDGTAVACTGFTHTETAEGHTVQAEVSGTETMPGIYADRWLPENVRVVNADGDEETGNYEITCAAGSLTIRKRKLTVSAKDVSAEYDGESHGGSSVEADRLLSGHRIADSTVRGSAAIPGVYADLLVPAAVQLTDESGESVLDLYSIVYEPGTLTIQPRALTIRAEDVTVLYDGSVHYADTVTADRLLTGHTIESIERGGGASQPGVHEAALTLSDAVLTDANGDDVTAYYDIRYEPGTLTIDLIPVTDVTLSASEIHLANGENVRLIAEVFPANASMQEVTWTSSNSAIVSVTSDGILTRHRSGSVVITAIATDGTGIAAKCVVRKDDLPYLRIPAALSAVEEEAWLGDSVLKAVDFSNTKNPVIGARAFQDCIGLVKVILPEGAVIFEDAFAGCDDVVLYCSDAQSMARAKEIGVPYAANAAIQPDGTSAG